MRASSTAPCWALLAVLAAAPAGAATHLMRFADIHDTQVVFTYEGDLWLASTDGGDARRITNDPGEERYAKFSPDGSQIAFTASFDGGRDVYVMDARGGIPKRLTYHPSTDNVLDWFPDGKSILFRSRRGGPGSEQLYRVSVDGGMEQRLPVDRAGLTAISPDGHSIAYNRISREFATWKRYQGGQAQAIWMGSLDRGDFRKITDWPGSNSWPMWQGNDIYFVSDRQFGTMNLYRYDVGSGQTTALTHYRDYDVKYPSIGPGAIVFQHAEQLCVLDLTRADAEPRPLDIQIRTDLTAMRPWYVDVDENHGSFGLSPDGSHMALEVRGEILSLPVEKDRGEPVNLTRTSGSREKNAAWSPDGKRIAFLSDRSGEEEIWLCDPSGVGDWKQLTRGNKGFRLQPVWSPDSHWLVFSDKFMRLNLVDAATGTLRVIAQGKVDDGWERWGIQDYVWSPDSKWIAYTRMNPDMNETIHAYSLATKNTLDLTDDQYTSWSPSFDPDGKVLYFLSRRTFDPIMGQIDQQHVFLDMTRPYALVLRADARSPFERDESGGGTTDSDSEDADDPKPDAKKKAPPAVTIDPGDFDRRTIAAPGVDAGDYFRLEATHDGFLYLSEEENHFDKYMTVTDVTFGELDLHHYVLHPDPGEEHDVKLMESVSNYHLSANGKKLVYCADRDYGVIETGKKGKAGDGKVELSRAEIKIDREQEYLQMFNEAWRVQRDWFYDPHMHGVDWEAVGAMYRKFVPDCGTRSDLVYLIGEMIAELNAGHTYSYGGDDLTDPKQIPTGLLGADFDAPAGSAYYRIARIVPGHSWSDAEASPFEAPGCPVRAGDYLIAIDGQEVHASDNLYAFLEDKADREVTITFNSKATKSGARTCRVHTLQSESSLRYRDWVETNRAYVDKASGGTIGYVHLSDMGEDGLRQFARDFHPQTGKQGMIVDVRYNGGGFVSDMIIDRMERKPWAIILPREGAVSLNPEGVFAGHYAVLVNEDTGSNGEYFARTVQIRRLGPVIGMRTWGGAVGLEVHELLVDGGSCTPPQFGAYEFNRKWVYEGRGVDPDIEVQNMPGAVLHGHDAQLDAAIASITRALEKEPVVIPPPPPFPNKAK